MREHVLRKRFFDLEKSSSESQKKNKEDHSSQEQKTTKKTLLFGAEEEKNVDEDRQEEEENVNEDRQEEEENVDEDRQEDEETINNDLFLSQYEQFCNKDENIQQYSSSTKESTVELQNPSFSMKCLSLYFADILQNHWNKDKIKETNFVFEGSRVPVNSFARALSTVFENLNLPITSHKPIMNVIYNAIGDKVNLPVSILKKVNNNNHNEDSSNDEKSIDSFETDDLHAERVSINLKSFNSEPPRCVGFDQCQHDCYVYAGSSSNSNNFNCPTCKTARFQPCSRSFCKGIGTESCEHLLTDGVALKKLWYRPILLLIMDLLSTQHFLTALNYDRKQIHGDSLYYSDFMDGAVPTQQLKEMKLNFKTHMEKNPTSSQTTKSVIILFSEFYDGVQLFKSRYNDFWPLCISIMNLPPLYRGKMGVGFFLAALYAGKHKEAEKFLLIDCFSEELNLLYNGVERTINGQTYFIQARLVLHILDTKAAEPILCVQMQSNARLGCALCGLIHGVHMGPKCCFIGHRHLLPPRHYLRFFGQSGRCCPTNFYSPEVKDMWYSETFLSDKNPISAFGLLEKEKYTASRKQLCQPCGNEANSIGSASDLLNFLNAANASYDWNHEGSLYGFDDIVIKELKHYIYYRHFDFRAQRPYRRIASDVHLNDAREAKLLNDSRKTKGSTKKNVNGIQDVWPFDRLPYSDIATQIDWPLLHAITGIEELLNGLLFGDKLWESRPQKEKKKPDVEPLKKPPVVVKTCPPYHPRDCPWEGSADEKKTCNAWLSCVILPSGCNNSWDLKKMISNDGVLKYTKMDQTLKVYTCFMSIIMYNFTKVPLIYKWFFLMFAHDMTRLQQSSILKSNVDSLTNDIIETVCIFEGLFFASAITSQLHQLIHMAPVINRFGPLMGISEFPGERSVGVLKRRKTKSSNTGGRSFERRIFNSQVEKEVRVLRSFYKEAVSDEPAAVNNKRSFKVDALGRLHYTERPFAMGKKESESTSKLSHNSFSDYEFHWFLKALIYELSKYEGQAILETSTFYRLFQLFKATKTSLDFTYWVQNVAEGEIALRDDECSSLAKELTSFKLDFFQNAYVYGIKMKSRGSNLRETNSPYQRQHDIFSGEFTDIKNHWSVKKHYSSWCKFDRHTNDNLSGNKKEYYGQINAFFQVSLRDVLLDKIMLASMTVMNYTTSPKPCFLEFVKVDSFTAKFLFVALSDILPTSIAIIPIDNIGKPMATMKNKLPTNDPTTNSYYSLYKGNEHYKLEKLVMVALHPEKSSMKPLNTAFKQFLFEE